MRQLHHALMILTLTAVIAVGIGTLRPSSRTAEAQHGHAADPQAQFQRFADRLELDEAQREAIAEPFEQWVDALGLLNHLHGSIAAELEGDQREDFARIVRDTLARLMPAGDDDDSHHRDGGRH